MAVRFMGTSAPYQAMDECTRCCAVNAGTPTSTGFGSCVGLVLHSDRHDMGVVAHFSGSLGKGVALDVATGAVTWDGQLAVRGPCSKGSFGVRSV